MITIDIAITSRTVTPSCSPSPRRAQYASRVPVDKPDLGRALSYFGSKYATAPLYPEPVHDLIIEPFAGGAGYSLRYWKRDVILIERSPDVCGAWRMLLQRGPDVIRRLPLLRPQDDLRRMLLTDDAKRLIGFWVNTGMASPRNRLCSWATDEKWVGSGTFWGERMRERLAVLSENLIGRWKIIEGDYTCAPDVEATWFIDPPYAGSLGSHYWRGGDMNFAALGEWCRARRGQVTVCEQTGATWLPFVHLATVKATVGKYRKGKADEAVWIKP